MVYKELEPIPTQRALQNPATFGAATDDLDIDIDPNDPLPVNGTVVIRTAGATDLDMNIFPPVEVSVIVQNDTVTVTNQTVTIGNPIINGDGDGGGDEE